MKQHIEEKQLTELDAAGMVKLYKFVRPNTIYRDDSIEYQHHHLCMGDTYEQFKGFAKDVTIGKMIEFLGKALYYMEPRYNWNWLVQIDDINIEYDEFEEKELCDALWKAVKCVLEHKE